MHSRVTQYTALVATFIMLLMAAFNSAVHAQQAEAQLRPALQDTFQLKTIFDLEFATDPQMAPGGDRLVYVRNSMDRQHDRRRSNLWMITTDGSQHRPLSSGNNNYGSPRWSPSGDRLLFTADGQLHMRWMDTGETAQISSLPQSPGGISWSPNGQWIAFTMMVPKESASMIQLPAQPTGADWAPPARVIDKLQYRYDGAGYLSDGHRHVFVMPAGGGSARQLTTGNYDHSGTPQWSPNGSSLYISANRHDDAQYNPRNSEIYRITVASGAITPLTDRTGPDSSPAISPDGSTIAYTGYDDELLGYQSSNIYLMDADGANKRMINTGLDRNPGNLQWAANGKALYAQYTDRGKGRVARITPAGEVTVLTDQLGGTAFSRPYSGGSYSVADGTVAFTHSVPQTPANIGVLRGNNKANAITALNEDVFNHTQLGAVEELSYESSYDGQQIQGWVVTPPNFDPSKKYPLILEIHGGPFASYGPHFSAEVQLYAAAGYVVLYTNPRGSTSYGQAFGNEIHHAYPGHDYDDLMSGVDAVIDRGYINEDKLYVTGGSGGGVLTAWIVGKTDRFRAAVVAKPVINWYSFVLTADNPATFYKYWFPGLPWNNRDQYMDRSPISLAGNVSTPTMLLTGEADYRTPISETEQFYTALKLQKVETVMVRIPDTGHHLATRPTNLMRKAAHILKWFEMHP